MKLGTPIYNAFRDEVRTYYFVAACHDGIQWHVTDNKSVYIMPKQMFTTDREKAVRDTVRQMRTLLKQAKQTVEMYEANLSKLETELVVAGAIHP